MGWDEIKAWMNNAARAAAGVVSPPAHSPGAVGIAGIRSMLPGSRSFTQELEAYNREAAPSPLYSPTSRFGSVVTDPARPLEPSAGERERQMQMALQTPFGAMTLAHGTPAVWAAEAGAPLGQARRAFAKTGEGGALKGEGFYAAQRGSVGEEYRRALSERRATESAKIKGQPWDAGAAGHGDPVANVNDSIVLAMSGEKPMTVEQAIADTRSRLKPFRTDDPEWYRKANAYLDSLSPADIEVAPRSPGSLYALDYPDELLPRTLDFDVPLSRQTPEVREGVAAALRKRGFEDWQIEAMTTRHDGQSVYNSLASKNGEEEASRLLAEVGIPGHRFLDQGSRWGHPELLFDGAPITSSTFDQFGGEHLPYSALDKIGTLYRAGNDGTAGDLAAAIERARKAGNANPDWSNTIDSIAGRLSVAPDTRTRNFVVYEPDKTLKTLGRYPNLDEFLKAHPEVPR